jgi:diguanylate cyclase (GGDEF)-like protein
MRDADPLACAQWLLQTTHSLMGIHHEQDLLVAITDGLLQLTGGERGTLWWSEAGTPELLPLCVRGGGGLSAPAPERKGEHSARRMLAAPEPSRVVMEGSQGRGLALAKVFEGGEARGVLMAEGQLSAGWADPSTLASYAKSASLALTNARMLGRASNDLLTGLPNSSALMSAVDKALKAKADAGAFGLVMLDLDGFKRVNAAAGADVGDRALIDIASTLRDALCTDGLVSRFGSDKFAVLLPAGPSQKVHLRLRDVAERARAAVSTKVFGGVQLSCSIAGMAATPMPQPSKTAREVVSACDQILTRLRRTGPGNIDIVVALPESAA